MRCTNQKADCPLECGWASSNQLKEIEGNTNPSLYERALHRLLLDPQPTCANRAFAAPASYCVTNSILAEALNVGESVTTVNRGDPPLVKAWDAGRGRGRGMCGWD